MSDPPIRLAVAGCSGRMGALLVEEAARDPSRFRVTGALEREGHPEVGRPLPAARGVRVTSDLRAALEGADLLVDFTTPEATLSHAEAAASRKLPVLTGTTGFTPAQMQTLRALGHRIPLFWSPNMSLGIVVVRRTIGSLSKLLLDLGLSEKTRVSISETHHARKQDAPSGTAKALRDELLRETGWLIRDEEIEAKREGEVIGSHSVTFECGPERITLTHEALDRRVFAQGALAAAGAFRRLWMKPGFYGMDDLLAGGRA